MCHPQTNDQAERFKTDILLHLRHYVPKHQKDLDAFVQLFVNTYNTQIHPSTNQTPYSLVLRRHPPGLILHQVNNKIPSDNHDKTWQQALRSRLKPRKPTLRSKGHAHKRKSQHCYKQDYDRHVRKTPKFQPELICLSWLTRICCNRRSRCTPTRP